MDHSKEKRKKEEKPKYESPVVVPLGEQAKGFGTAAHCPTGSGATTTCGGGSGT